MPELPEVETIRRELNPLLKGKTFAAAELIFPTTVAYPSPEAFIANLSGLTVDMVGRRGKYLLIRLNRGCLVVHLRMTGNLIYYEKAPREEARHLRAVLPFLDGSALYYADQRRFGRLWLTETEAELESIVLKNIGPDIYDEMDQQQFLQKLTEKEYSGLKSLLLNQRFAAGMGNIYVDECLHSCGFHPLARVKDLSAEERARLYNASRQVLEMGIEHGGTTFRDYRSAVGALGDFQSRLKVYGRKGKKCSCGTFIEKATVAGRGTFFCPRCQVQK